MTTRFPRCPRPAVWTGPLQDYLFLAKLLAEAYFLTYVLQLLNDGEGQEKKKRVSRQ